MTLKSLSKTSIKKKGWMLILAGTICLAICLLLLIKTDSIFSTVFFYLSLALSIAGAYIVMWKKDKKEDEPGEDS